MENCLNKIMNHRNVDINTLMRGDTKETKRKKQKRKDKQPKDKQSRVDKLHTDQASKTNSTRTKATPKGSEGKKTKARSLPSLRTEKLHKEVTIYPPSGDQGDSSSLARATLRWEGVLEDPVAEAERIEVYKANRRKRYLASQRGVIGIMGLGPFRAHLESSGVIPQHRL